MTAYRTTGQLPSLGGIVTDTKFELAEHHSLITGIIQFHPRVWKLIDVVHYAVDIRLHNLIDNQLCMTW